MTVGSYLKPSAVVLTIETRLSITHGSRRDTRWNKSRTLNTDWGGDRVDAGKREEHFTIGVCSRSFPTGLVYAFKFAPCQLFREMAFVLAIYRTRWSEGDVTVEWTKGDKKVQVQVGRGNQISPYIFDSTKY